MTDFLWGSLAGFSLGASFMWIYFVWAGLMRSRGEFYLAKGLGNEAMDAFCTEARRDLLRRRNGHD